MFGNNKLYESNLYLFVYPHYFTVKSVRSEHKTTKVMIYTYCWSLIVTGKGKTEQEKRLGPVRSVQCAVSRKTLKYSHSRHCVKLVWAGFWWSSKRVGHYQSRSGASVQDSIDVTSAAMLGICVLPNKCRHNMVLEIGMSKFCI